MKNETDVFSEHMADSIATGGIFDMEDFNLNAEFNLINDFDLPTNFWSWMFLDVNLNVLSIYWSIWNYWSTCDVAFTPFKPRSTMINNTRMDKRAFYLMQHLSHDIYAFWMRFALRLSFSIFMTFDLKVFPQHAISNLKFKTRIISNKCIHYKTLSFFSC